MDATFDEVKRSISASLVALGIAVFGVPIVACSTAEMQTDPDTTDTPESPNTPATTVKEADASVPDTAAACKTVPPNNRCGLDPQCGCGTNETCDVTNSVTGATSCLTAGSATVGRPCNGTGDCIQGLACVYGACRPYCTSPLSKCSVTGTELCVTTQDPNTGADVPNANVCTITCDPRVPTGVCGTNSCLWFPDTYMPNKVSDCNFAGTVGALEDCTGDYDCIPGYACVSYPLKNMPARMECEHWCRIGVAADCEKGFSCKDVYGDNAPVINGMKEGVCQD